jgi:hypothetical protein
MTDPKDAAAALLAKLENAIKTADPKLAGEPMSINELLGAFVPSIEHASAALIVGQNAHALLALARRQFAEVGTHLKNLAATMPANDANAAKLKAIRGGLK